MTDKCYIVAFLDFKPLCSSQDMEITHKTVHQNVYTKPLQAYECSNKSILHGDDDRNDYAFSDKLCARLILLPIQLVYIIIYYLATIDIM